MKSLSDQMWLMLNYMRAGSGIAYGTASDPTYKALQARGLVSFSKARKYGKDCWHLTEAGKAFDLSK